MTIRDRFGTTAPPRKKKREKSKPLPTLTVISHPDPRRIGDLFVLPGFRMDLSRLHPDFSPPGGHQGQPLDDPFISRAPICLEITRGGLLVKPNFRTEVQINGQILEDEMLLKHYQLAAGVVMVLADRVVLLIHHSLPFPDPRTAHGFVGHSDAIRRLRSEITRVVDIQTPVLLRGQSGTGKELAANAIHKAGSRRGPFVSVNMGAIPSSLAASELFGAVKGAYTGSDRHQLGFFRSAEEGTLFLDEIGETAPEVQVLLLRALETGEVSPVGAQRSFPFNTRFLAATDADLENKMKEDSFKSPLFHRLSGYEIRLPTLRERLEDLGRLFVHFAKDTLAEVGEPHRLQLSDPYDDPWIPVSLMTALLSAPWPGNVRQLRNVTRQLVIGCRGEACLTLLPNIEEMLETTTSPEPQQKSGPPAAGKKRKPSALPDAEVIEAMRANEWDINATAATLGISRGALYGRIDKIPGLKKAADLTAETILTALEQESGDMDAAARNLEVAARALRRRCNVLGIG